MTSNFDCAGGASQRGAQTLTRRADAAQNPSDAALVGGICQQYFLPMPQRFSRRKCSNIGT